MNMQAWQARRNERRFAPRFPIRFAEVPAPAPEARPASGTTTIWFRLGPSDAAGLEAVRDARRAMIREDRTVGLEDGEPSLAEAVFSASGVLWEVPVGELARCREKLALLQRRANAIAEATTRRRLS